MYLDILSSLFFYKYINCLFLQANVSSIISFSAKKEYKNNVFYYCLNTNWL